MAAFGPRIPDTRCGMLGDDVRPIEISDRQNREGQHPLSAGPRAGYRRDWLIVWPLESARAHGGLTELGNADLPDTQIRALRGFDLRASTFGKTMPFFGNILPTLRAGSSLAADLTLALLAIWISGLTVAADRAPSP